MGRLRNDLEIVEVPVAESNIVPKLTVETSDNHVYFYATVDSDRCLALIKEIRELDKDLRNERLTRELPDDFPHTPIWLHINSGGGSLFDGFGLADQLVHVKTPIYSIVEGYTASAATLISMSCTKRFILPSAYMLVHQLSSMAWGTYEQIKDDVHLMDMAMERLIDFYAVHSNMKRKAIKKMLSRDSWFNANECIEKGFVDGIYA
jgi:ATP-dependent Clp protease protease subunit